MSCIRRETTRFEKSLHTPATTTHHVCFQISSSDSLSIFKYCSMSLCSWGYVYIMNHEPYECFYVNIMWSRWASDIFLTIWNTNTHHTIYKSTCLIHVVFTKMAFHQFTSHPPPGQVIQVLQVSQASPGASLVHRTVSLRFRYVFALLFSHADDSPDGWTGHQFHSNQCDHGSTRETKPTINGHNISTTSQTSLIEIPVPAPPMPPNHPFLDVFELQTVFFQIRWANITPAFKVIPIPRGRVVRCYGTLDQTWPLLVWCVQSFDMQYPLTHSRHLKQQNYHKLLWLSYPRPSPNRQTPKKFPETHSTSCTSV